MLRRLPAINRTVAALEAVLLLTGLAVYFGQMLREDFEVPAPLNVVLAVLAILVYAVFGDHMEESSPNEERIANGKVGADELPAANEAPAAFDLTDSFMTLGKARTRNHPTADRGVRSRVHADDFESDRNA